MGESGKTKRQLLDEIEALNQRLLELQREQTSPKKEPSSSPPETFDHSYRLLLTLSKAATTVQTAHTSQEVYDIVGRKIRHLGYQAIILLLNGDASQLKVAYTTIDSPLSKKIGEIAGVSLNDYQFEIKPGSIYSSLLSKNETKFFDNVIIPIKEALPNLSKKGDQRLADLLGIETAIYAPLIIEQKTLGLLCVTGRDLCEANTVAVNIFANQVAITLEKVQLSEALQFDELRYHSLFDQAAESIVLIDPSNGEIVEFNHSTYENLGYTREEFERLHIHDFEMNESPEEVKLHFEKVLQDGSDTFETRHRTKDGEIRHIQVNIKHIQIGGQNFIQGIWNDITDRVAAEKQLEKYRENLEELVDQRTMELAVSEKRYRSLVENALVGVIQVSAEGKILYANPEMAGMLKFPSAKKMIGVDFCSLCRELKDWQQLIREIEPEKQIRNLKIDMLTQEGGIINVLISLTREDGVLSGMIKNITEQKQAEESYHESQRRLTTLMDNLPGMAYRCQNDADWTMEFVNQNSLKLTGYSPRELINNSRVSFVDIVHPDDRQMIWDSIQEAVEQKRPYQLTYRIETADGKEKWVWEQGEAIYTENGKVLALEGFITDISEQKNAEQALRESEERFRSTLDNMLEGCQILDHDWRYVYLNDAADVHNRRPKQELLGNRYMDMWPGIEETEVFRRIKDTLEKHVPHHLENEFVFPNGKIGWFDLSIQPVPEGVFILSVDITDRKRAQQQLQDAAQQWQTTFNAMRDGVALLDIDRKILRCNQALCDLTGKTYNDLIGKLGGIAIHGYDKQQSDCPIQRAVHTLKRETKEIKNNNRWYYLIADPILDRSRELTGFVYTVADITERKQIEQALRENEERLRSTMDNMLEGCQIIGKDWTYLYVNDTVVEQARKSRKELVGLTMMELFPGIEKTPMFAELEKSIHDQESRRIENEFFYGDGSSSWFELSIQPVPEGLFILSIDITEQKLAQERLRSAAQQWLTTFNAMRDGVALLDADRKVVRCNQALCDLTGKTMEELVGQVCCKVIHGVDGPLMHCPVTRSARTKHREVLEIQIGTQWLVLIADPILDAQNHITGFVHLVGDITERKRAEQQINYQAYLLSNVNDAVMASDENFMLTSWNRTAQQMYGWSEEEVLGKNGEDLLQPDFIDITSEEIEKQLMTEGSFLAEAMQLRKDGTKIPVEIRMNALYDEAGKMNGYVSVNRDITERLQAEEEIRRHIKRVEAMLEISQAVSSTLDLKKVLDSILSKISQIIQCDSMSVLLFQDDMMEILACRGFEQPEQVVGLRFALDPKLPSYDVMKKMKPVAVTDISHDYPDFKILINQNDYEELGSWAGIPLISKGVPIGLIALDRVRKEPFAEEELQLVTAVAGQAGLAIENARLFGEANQHLKRLTSLRDIDKAISSSFDLNLTLSVLLEQVRSQLGVDAAGVLLFHPTLNSLEYTAVRGFRGRGIMHSNLKLGEGYAGRAALEQRMVEVADLRTAAPPFARSDLIIGEDFVSYYAVPLIAKGQIKGVLEVFHRSLLHPNQEWLDFLETLGGQTAIAVDNAELFENLQRSNLDLTFAYDKTIEGWSRAMDLRDHETEGHTLRVADLAVRLAREMSIPKQQIVHLRRGALLHDMGKLGIPDAILHKPGKLTPEEWEIMKQHPRFAYAMLSSIDYLQPALDIPYCHHEKWDGTGYPRGLKGEQIPLVARIFAIVDVWDALRSDRPYRKAWSEEKTLDYIREQSGTHFDPQVVNAFMRIIGELQVNK